MKIPAGDDEGSQARGLLDEIECGCAGLPARTLLQLSGGVDEEFRGFQKPLNLTVSIGVAGRRFPEDRASDYRDLVRLADEQLYRAKTTGKNKVCIREPEKPQEVA